jgi:hypothetical protein
MSTSVGTPLRDQKVLWRVASITALIITTAFTAFAQSGPESREAAKAWANEYVRFFKFESKLTPQDVDRLVELRMKLYAPTSSLEDRQAAMKEFGMMLFRVAGTTPAPPEAFYTRFGENQGRLFHQLMTDPNAKRVDKTTPLGQLGQVEKRGRGPVPVILIADVRTDWTIYQSFIDRNAERYTMYAVRRRRRNRRSSISPLLRGGMGLRRACSI